MFNGIVVLVPKNARKVDDDLYRAVDIYLKAHPNIESTTIVTKAAISVFGEAGVTTATGLMTEIGARVEKNPITCFVKCYDRTFQGNNVRAYVVMHMYSREASTRVDENAETMLLHGDSSKATADVEGSGSEQLFSPTAPSAEASSMLLAPAKRPLFGTKEKTESGETPMQVVDVDDSSNLGVDGVSKHAGNDGNKASPSTVFGSPIKKTKNKLKEC